MRASVLAGVVGVVVAGGAGCFDPKIPTGAPCDPAAPACPQEQMCVAGPGGYTCELPGGARDAATGGPDAPPGAPDAMGSTDGPPGGADAPPVAGPDAAPVHLELVATVAECVDPKMPSPAACKMYNGTDQLAIDHRDTTTADPWYAFVRFEVDGSIAGRTVTSVVLRLTATSDAKADGPHTGEVWAVTAFDASSLTATTPQHTGAAPLAGSQGSVVELEVVDWPLPVTAVTASAPAYFGLETPSTDGVAYWNLAGPNPPRLIIDAQ